MSDLAENRKKSKQIIATEKNQEFQYEKKGVVVYTRKVCSFYNHKTSKIFYDVKQSIILIESRFKVECFFCAQAKSRIGN